MGYTYGTGQRPLDGYTLKRALGRGGFGEVYYAVSDGGKEVALKLVKGGDAGATELRGIAHCMNLKHPNLVAVYDLKTDPRGDHWVVMEYVAGETLHQVLARHPDGPPRDQAVRWFHDLARGVGHLHEHGIVHRDLKPANLFVEAGVLKVGDYGLSKPADASSRGHTAQVGTVHYMAPEVRQGAYGRSVDVYACGVMLYELLTGRVPFDGATASEVLMKHMVDPPDLTPVPAAFAPVVRKALEKEPARRYATVEELDEAVSRAAGEVSPPPATTVAPAPGIVPPVPPTLPPLPPEVRPAGRTWRDRAGELCGSLAGAAAAAVVTTAAWAALTRTEDAGRLGSVYLLTVAAAWAVLVPGKFWRPKTGDALDRRALLATLGFAVGVLALWLSGWEPRGGRPLFEPASYSRSAGPSQVFGAYLKEAGAAGAGYVVFFTLALGAMRWWKLTERRRRYAVKLGPVLAAGFWGFVLASLYPGDWSGPVAVAAAALVVQWVSPWEPAPPDPPKKLRLRLTR